MKITHLLLQITDLIPHPKNPRVIKDEKYGDLVQSLRDFPEMLEIRRIIIDEKNVILGGSKRFEAHKDAGRDKAYVTRVEGLTDEKKAEFLFKDNTHFGEWDIDMIAEWELPDLGKWGVELQRTGKMVEFKEKNPEVGQKFYVNIEVPTEKAAKKLFDRFTAEGMKCKITQ